MLSLALCNADVVRMTFERESHPLWFNHSLRTWTVGPNPVMNCVGNYCDDHLEAHVVRCEYELQSGWSTVSDWECTAAREPMLPRQFEYSSFAVLCQEHDCMDCPSKDGTEDEADSLRPIAMPDQFPLLSRPSAFVVHRLKTINRTARDDQDEDDDAVFSSNATVPLTSTRVLRCRVFYSIAHVGSILDRIALTALFVFSASFLVLMFCCVGNRKYRQEVERHKANKILDEIELDLRIKHYGNTSGTSKVPMNFGGVHELYRANKEGLSLGALRQRCSNKPQSVATNTLLASGDTYPIDEPIDRSDFK